MKTGGGITDKILELLLNMEHSELYQNEDKGILTLFKKHKKLTLRQVQELLRQDGCLKSIEEIEYEVNLLLADQGLLLRDDFWSKEALYRYISNEHFQDSALTKSYYSFQVDDDQSKKFLLISDTHIGNPDLENFDMIKSVYQYAITHQITHCFHLGEIFSGIKLDDWNDEEILRQLNLFIEHYPSSEKIKTYALIGNHDETIHGFYHHNILLPYTYDLRQLAKYVKNFYVIPKISWDTTFSNILMHFSHRFYLNFTRQNKKINNLEDILLDQGEYFECLDGYNIFVSGHLHNGFVYSNPMKQTQEQLYLGVPSLTNINQNGIVGYVVFLNYNEGEVANAVITPLKDNNGQIEEAETINWNFGPKNQLIRRLYK